MTDNICGVPVGGYVTIECTDGISGNDCAGEYRTKVIMKDGKADFLNPDGCYDCRQEQRRRQKRALNMALRESRLPAHWQSFWHRAGQETIL